MALIKKTFPRFPLASEQRVGFTTDRSALPILKRPLARSPRLMKHTRSEPHRRESGAGIQMTFRLTVCVEGVGRGGQSGARPSATLPAVLTPSNPLLFYYPSRLLLNSDSRG